MKGGLADNVSCRCAIFDDSVRNFLGGFVELHRQAQQEVMTQKNRPNFDR